MKYQVTKKAMRPASNAEQCFYCQQPLGGFHLDNCVLISKKVLIRATIEYEVEMPSHWDAKQIEFNRNEGSWCADNMLEELKELTKDNECLCSRTTFEFLKDSDDFYLNEQ